MKVFVYGSLKQGYHFSDVLLKSKFIETTTTKEKYLMLNLGSFPGVIKTPRDRIVGELYEIDKKVLKQLDRIESHPDFYIREIVKLANGDKAWMYFLNEGEDAIDRYDIVSSGEW